MDGIHERNPQDLRARLILASGFNALNFDLADYCLTNCLFIHISFLSFDETFIHKYSYFQEYCEVTA